MVLLPWERNSGVALSVIPKFSGKVVGVESPAVFFRICVWIIAFIVFFEGAHWKIFGWFSKKSGEVCNAHFVHVDAEEIVEEHNVSFVRNGCFELRVCVAEGGFAVIAIFFFVINFGDVAIWVCDFVGVTAFATFEARRRRCMQSWRVQRSQEKLM